MFPKRNISDANIERRKHGRSDYEVMISHEILTDDKIQTGKMFNFSKGGLYFESDQLIYTGDEILIKVPMLSNQLDNYEQLPIDVEIIWRHELENSAFEYGYGGRYVLENEYIDNETHPSELQSRDLPDYRIEDVEDPRNHPRRPLNQLLLIKYKNQVHKGLIKDLSSGGAFIETRSDFHLGTEIELVIAEGKVSEKTIVKGQVVRFSPKGFAVSFTRGSAQRHRNNTACNDIGKPENKNGIDSGTRRIAGYPNEMPFEF